MAAVIGGGMAVGGQFKDDFTVPGIESQQAQDLLEQRFPAQSGTQAVVVFSGELGQRDAKHAHRRRRSTRSARSRTSSSVENPYRTAGRLSDNGRVAYATVSYDQTATDLDAKARERLEDATAGLGKAGVDVAMSGEPIDGAATGGFPVGEVIGLVIAIVLLSPCCATCAPRATRSAPRSPASGSASARSCGLAAATDVPGLAPTLGGMLGLGAGIDYALLLAARQQEELRAGRSPLDAARRANATAGHSARHRRGHRAGVHLRPARDRHPVRRPRRRGRRARRARLRRHLRDPAARALRPGGDARCCRSASAPPHPPRPPRPRAPWATKRPGARARSPPVP